MKQKSDAIEHRRWFDRVGLLVNGQRRSLAVITVYLVFRIFKYAVKLPNLLFYHILPAPQRSFPLFWYTRRRMKTQGEIESAISEGMGRFEQEYMGRGPKDVHVHLINDLIVVRLKGVLTAAEQHLVQTLPSEKGRDLLKQVRSHLIEVARPMMEAMVLGITGVKVISLHHDISTVSGEEIVLFILAESPLFRETRKR
ncbi:MAG: DUF2294 domain-containing protein [Planctomycetota bacterium]|nr:DUF2294 domain-containing protein [Planctomycetota bacterium]